MAIFGTNTTASLGSTDTLWVMLAHPNTLLVTIILIFFLSLLVIMMVGLFIAITCIFFCGIRCNKRVYVSWWHGDRILDTLTTDEHLRSAHQIIQSLQREGRFGEYEGYDAQDEERYMTYYNCCFSRCLGRVRSIRARKEVFQQLPGYPDFDMDATIERQQTTNIDV